MQAANNHKKTPPSYQNSLASRRAKEVAEAFSTSGSLIY